MSWRTPPTPPRTVVPGPGQAYEQLCCLAERRSLHVLLWATTDGPSSIGIQDKRRRLLSRVTVDAPHDTAAMARAAVRLIEPLKVTPETGGNTR